MLSADVAVVGAGPAGAAAAITAVAAGLRVVVVDRATFPRDKCCGDGLTTGALRRLDQLGFSPDSLPSWQPVGGARIRTPDGRTGVFRLPDDAIYAATLRRTELDAALVDRARSAGADVREGKAMVAARPGPEGTTVELVLDDGEVIRAWYAIGADGMWSPLRKAVGAGDPGYLGEWHAGRQYVRHTGPEARDLLVWFEDDLRPGYVWSFPLPEGGANVGFGIRRRPGQAIGTMKQRWEELLRRPHIASVLGPDAEPEGPLKTWPIPARIGGTRLSALGGRVLFVGDAARASDCMTGEGIGQALETGQLAAKILAASGPLSAGAVATAYRSTIARGMALDDLLSGAFSRVLSSPRGANAWFDIAAFGERSRRVFARWMFEDYPRAAPLTPWRWHRGMWSRPGVWPAPALAAR